MDSRIRGRTYDQFKAKHLMNLKLRNLEATRKEKIQYLHVVPNTSILVNNSSFDVRVLANANRNTTLCRQKPPVSISLVARQSYTKPESDS